MHHRELQPPVRGTVANGGRVFAMRAVVQRVSQASVSVGGDTIGTIGPGLLMLIGVANRDTEADALAIASKVAGLRIFRDADRKMNLSVTDVRGSVLLVSQFTLYGSVSKGRRPSFVDAASGEIASPLVDIVGRVLQELGLVVATGEFGADMIVELTNDGPVTLVIETQDGRVL